MDDDLNPVSDGGGSALGGQTAAAGDIDLMGAKSNELLFAQAANPTPPNEEAVGLIFDFNPLDPTVITVVGAVVVCLVAATWWCRRKPSKTSRATTTTTRTTGGCSETASAATGRPPSPVIRSPYNTRGPRATTPGSGRSARRASSNRSSPPGNVMILTPQQLALCEVLYDVYNGVVPSRGIESKAVQECELSTADIRRQFENIKRARELDGEKTSSSSDNIDGSGAPPSSPTPRRAAQSRLTRPSTRRASTAAAAAAAIKQQPETGKQPSSRAKKSSRIPVPSKRTAAAAAAVAATAPSTKKPPVSPRSTPVKRGTAARPGTAGGGGGRGSPARPAKRAAPSPPSGRSAASVLPSSPPESPVRTRGRSNRTPSVRIGSPKSAPTKRAAAAAAAAAASSPRSGGGGTPSKRGKPSVLEIARREAQQQTVDVASTRASSLRARRSSRSNTNTATRRGTKS